jgi:hypothetical protein
MIKTVNYIYYCVYLFSDATSSERWRSSVPSKARGIFFIAIFMYCSTVYGTLGLDLVFPGTVGRYILGSLAALIFIIVQIYFIRNDNGKNIVAYYNEKRNMSKILDLWIGILFSAFSVGSFIIGSTLAKYFR